MTLLLLAEGEVLHRAAEGGEKKETRNEKEVTGEGEEKEETTTTAYVTGEEAAEVQGDKPELDYVLRIFLLSTFATLFMSAAGLLVTGVCVCACVHDTKNSQSTQTEFPACEFIYDDLYEDIDEAFDVYQEIDGSEGICGGVYETVV